MTETAVRPRDRSDDNSIQGVLIDGVKLRVAYDVDEDGHRELRVGNKNTEYIPLTAINRITQVRGESEYDPVQIEELADAMLHIREDELLVEFELINALSVGKFTSEESVKRYLEQHAEVHQLQETTVVEQAPDGNFYLLISGHRRMLAIEMLSERFEVDPNDVRVLSSLYVDPEFYEAYIKQMRENTYVPPHPVSDARAIENYWLALVKDGEKPSKTSVARSTGYSWEKVSNAMKFAQLYADLQEMAATKVLPYSVCTRIPEIQESYRELFEGTGTYDEEDLEELVYEKTRGFSTKLAKERGKGKTVSQLNTLIDHQLQIILHQSLYDSPEKFWGTDEAKEARRYRKQQENDLGEFAVGGVVYLEGQDVLSEDQEKRVLAVAERIKAKHAEGKGGTKSRTDHKRRLRLVVND